MQSTHPHFKTHYLLKHIYEYTEQNALFIETHIRVYRTKHIIYWNTYTSLQNKTHYLLKHIYEYTEQNTLFIETHIRVYRTKHIIYWNTYTSIQNKIHYLRIYILNCMPDYTDCTWMRILQSNLDNLDEQCMMFEGMIVYRVCVHVYRSICICASSYDGKSWEVTSRLLSLRVMWCHNVPH